MNVRRRAGQLIQYAIPLLFYAAFVGLYVSSFNKVWVHRQFFLDAAVKDAGIHEYQILYQPVITLGGVLLFVFLACIWRSWSRKLMCFTHILLGMFALAYCGNLWADVDQNFNLFYSGSWFKSGAELGTGFFLFFSSAVCLIFASLSALMVSMDSEGSST